MEKVAQFAELIGLAQQNQNQKKREGDK